MAHKFFNPEEISERAMQITIRNEKRHQEVINDLLKILKTNNIEIPDDSLIDYLENRFMQPLEIRENEDEMTVRIDNERTHRDVISFFEELLQSNNVDIPDESLKDYLENIGKYDCMWEDYRK